MAESDQDPRQKFKQCRRYNDAGHAHAMNFCCFRRQEFLAKDRSCEWLAQGINLARDKHACDVWSYVFMPDHVHLLLRPQNERYEMSSILATIKQSVTRKALAYVRRHAPTFLPAMLDEQPNGRRHYRYWQRGGGFDRNLVTEEAVFAEIEYMHANPVRRGLCARPEDWAWSSAADYAGRREGPVRIDFGSLPRIYLIGGD